MNRPIPWFATAVIVGLLTHCSAGTGGIQNQPPPSQSALKLSIVAVQKTTNGAPAGKSYAMVQVTLTNVSRPEAAAMSQVLFTARSSSQVVYNAGSAASDCDPLTSVATGGSATCWIGFLIPTAEVAGLVEVAYSATGGAADATASLDGFTFSFAPRCTSISLINSFDGCGADQCMLQNCLSEHDKLGNCSNQTNAWAQCKTSPYCQCERAALMPYTGCAAAYDAWDACLQQNCAVECGY